MQRREQKSRLIGQPRTGVFRAERGFVFIAVMLVLIVMTGMALSFGRSMRVRVQASANRYSQAQAKMIALGAAEAVLALEDQLPSDAVDVNGGGFWLLRPDPDDERTYAFGVGDESAKIDLNSASREMLEALPGMTIEMAAAIIDWRDGDSEISESGAESEYYLRQPEPYRAKDGDFESVEELMLVRDFTSLELFGEDLNRNGYLDDNEDDASESLPGDNRDGTLDRGLIDLLTVHGTAGENENAINVNASAGGQGGQGGQGGGGGGGGLGGQGGGGGFGGGGQGGGGTQTDDDANQQLQDLLVEQFGTDRGNAIWTNIIANRPHANLMDLYFKSQMEPEEFDSVVEQLTTGDATDARVNVTLAPREVLRALPGLEDADVEALISARRGVLAQIQADAAAGEDAPVPLAWVAEALGEEKAIEVGGVITARGDRRVADILAISPGGRSFERYRMVYQNDQVVEWRRLTHLGWPLGDDIRQRIRDGEAVTDVRQTTQGGAF